MRTMDHEYDPDQYDPGFGRGMGRSVYREVEEHAPAQQPEPQHDLTLGMTALLGIFLAVVLVCAVFFGFGYSTGRTLHSAKSAPAPATLAPQVSSNTAAAEDAGPAPSTPALAAVQPAAKPSAGAPLTDESPADPGAPVGQDAAAVQAADEAAAHPFPAHRGGSAAGRPVYAEAASGGEVGAPSAGTAGGVMVQIAAVARQGDAEMLARALRGNGYPAVVRTEPQDKFLHVQIGPFATRDQAKAMRARLQGAGYNAFLKQ